LIRIQLISRKVNVPRARNPNVVLKPVFGQLRCMRILEWKPTKVEHEDQCEKLDKVFGHLFEAR
jgi:hypothetical protein